MVALSKVLASKPWSRIDSTFFQKEGLAVEATLLGRESEDMVAVSSSILSFGAYALTNQVEYQDEGIPFLRCADIKRGFVSFGDVLHIDDATHHLLHKSQVDPKTVLLTMSGTVGEAAVALPEWHYPINSNQDIAKIRTRGVSPYYLAAFLGSRFGQAQLARLPVGSVQQHIFLSMIETLKVARLGSHVEDAIAKIARQAYLVREDVARIIAKAENGLLDALGLRDWCPPKPLTYARAASAVVDAGRLDAQFHAPAVLALHAKLEEKFELTSLGTLGDVTNGRTVQYSEQGSVPIIRSGDVGKAHNLTALLRADASEPIFFAQRGDVLISSIGFGSIGRVEAIDTDAALGTVSEVTVVRQSKVDAHYLTAFLRSFAGQLQLERLITGATGQLHLYPRDVRTVFVPVLTEEAQQAQRTRAEAANAQRVRSAQLLEAAKRAVEIAIEQDEAAALRFISEHGEGTDAGSA